MHRALSRAAELALAGLLPLAAACTSRGPDEPSRAPAVAVPTFTVAPPAPPPPPAAPDARDLVPAEDPVCVLTESDIELVDGIPLRVEESEPFLHVHEARKLEVRLASPRSTVQASRSDLDVVGHVKLTDVPVRLRADVLVHGYLRLHGTWLRADDPTQLALEVPRLSFLAPVQELPAIPVTCDEIALARRPVRPETARGRAIGLRRGQPIDLRAKPGGPVVARVSFRQHDPRILEPLPRIDVFEIEQRGHEVLVRIEAYGIDVEGWVAQGDVVPRAEARMLGALGGVARHVSTIALAGEVPLLVRTGGDVVRVGTARPGTFPCAGPSSLDGREIQLDLDAASIFTIGFSLGEGPRPAKAKLFVVPTRGETCAAPPRR